MLLYLAKDKILGTFDGTRPYTISRPSDERVVEATTEHLNSAPLTARDHKRHPDRIMSQIVEATTAHVASLLPLFESYRAFYGRAPAEDASRRFLLQRIGQGESIILMALDEAGVGVGFVQLYPSFSSVRLCRHWILNDLFVSERARRNGIGKALLRAAVERVSESGTASLELATQRINTAARSLYESMGWKVDEEFDRYFFES